jgi:Ca2+-binding EF-hand superfamily protein
MGQWPQQGRALRVEGAWTSAQSAEARYDLVRDSPPAFLPLCLKAQRLSHTPLLPPRPRPSPPIPSTPRPQKEIEDMIWEVDESLDGCVDWEEFQLMFKRNLNDKTGLEPTQLFNVVQFLMYDKDFSGEVSVDETMQMLFSRYGKERLEAEMKALFGDSLSTDGDGILTFLDYLKAVTKRAPAKVEAGKGGKK